MEQGLRVLGQERLTLREASDCFMFRCRAERLSPHTVRFYQVKLNNLLLRIGGDTLLKEVTADRMRGFLTWLSIEKHRFNRPGSGNMSPESVAGHFRAAQALFNYLVREGFLEASPLTNVRPPRAPRRQIVPLSQEQVKALLRAPNRGTLAGLRDYIMILMLLDTGVRISELLSLRVSDVNWQHGTVVVMGKGSKERTVPVGARVRRELQRYLVRRGALQGFEPLFASRHGSSVAVRRFQQRMAGYGRKAGIEGVRVSPHTLRHTFATHWVRSGGDIFTLQQILGHSTLAMVQRYLSLSGEDLAAKHRRHSLVDRL